VPSVIDIVLLGAQWQTRALLRAQLVEEGFEVLATDTWPMMRQHVRPGEKPRLAIVDLQGLPDPERVLNDLRVLMKPDRVLVLTAIDTVAPDAIERLGFRVLKRPVAIGDVVTAVTRTLQEQRVEHKSPRSGQEPV
jgi:ActR/RegA family two-component response regulator